VANMMTAWSGSVRVVATIKKVLAERVRMLPTLKHCRKAVATVMALG
jgi:hypothetical protein